MNISIKDVNVCYKKGEKNALSNISFEMETTNYIGLLGPNGSGKSTLMKIITNEIAPTSGEVTVNGISLQKKDVVLKNNLGYLPQHFGLFDELTTFEYLDYIGTLKSSEVSKKDIEDILDKTNLSAKRNSKIKNLSGGQRQRIGISQALLGDSKILIFDEPTVGLDPEERIYFRNLFLERSKESIILISTHIIEDIQAVCNRLIILVQGNVIFNDYPEELIKQAVGHIGFASEEEYKEKNFRYPIIAKVMTTKGIFFRFINENSPLPAQYKYDEPTLEDAYMYLLEKNSNGGLWQ